MSSNFKNRVASTLGYSQGPAPCISCCLVPCKQSSASPSHLLPQSADSLQLCNTRSVSSPAIKTKKIIGAWSSTFIFQRFVQNFVSIYPRLSSPVTLGLAGEDRDGNHHHPWSSPTILHKVLLQLKDNWQSLFLAAWILNWPCVEDIHHDVPQFLIEDLVASLNYRLVCSLVRHVVSLSTSLHHCWRHQSSS